MKSLEEKLGYTFRDQSLLENALTHSSCANESKGRLQSNERLEFLGDSILGMVVAEHLYRNHPDLPEGELTRTRAALVCEESLVEVARDLGLGDYLKLGKGEETGGGRTRPSIRADAVEAVLAAVYLDGGIGDAIPWKHALEQGCDRLLVVLTHPRDYVRKPDPMQKLLHRTYRDYPNFLHVMEHRAHVYNENREELFQLERQGKVKVILPDSTMGVSRTEKDPEKLRLLWAKGYQMAVDRMEELKDYFSD